MNPGVSWCEVEWDSTRLINTREGVRILRQTRSDLQAREAIAQWFSVHVRVPGSLQQKADVGRIVVLNILVLYNKSSWSHIWHTPCCADILLRSSRTLTGFHVNVRSSENMPSTMGISLRRYPLQIGFSNLAIAQTRISFPFSTLVTYVFAVSRLSSRFVER